MGCGGSKPAEASPKPTGDEAKAQPIDQTAIGLVMVTTLAPAPAAAAAVAEPSEPAVPAGSAVEAPKAAEGSGSFIDGVFSFFAKADTDKSRSIDPAELSRSLSLNGKFKQQLCKAAGVENPEAMSDDAIAAEVLRKADTSGDGALQFSELEALLRGWKPNEHEMRADMTQANEQRRLAGAKERAERARVEGGGFAGLTDADEALRVGEAAQALTAAEKFTFNESEPTVWHDGAVYVTDPEAMAARDEREKQIRQQEMDEYLYKEQFKGITDAEEALRVGNSVKLGGEVVEVEGSAPKKSMPAGLAAKMKKQQQKAK